MQVISCANPGYFNPPSPCGEGRMEMGETQETANFNPPSPCGEGQAPGGILETRIQISIHPPRVGRDNVCRRKPKHCPNFNPPSPCGEGQQKLTKILCKLLC